MTYDKLFTIAMTFSDEYAISANPQAEFQKDKNVRDPNLGMKMSNFGIPVNNPEIRMIFVRLGQG